VKELSYDAAVIGGGAAGMAAALELRLPVFHVLLLNVRIILAGFSCSVSITDLACMNFLKNLQARNTQTVLSNKWKNQKSPYI